MDIPFREDYPPKNDVVFSIMFGEVELFAVLLRCVTGHVLKTKKIYSQASLKPENIEHNYIRFDTYSDEDDGTIYSIDMQNTYLKELIRNRTIYYACRAIAGQTVRKGAYEKLNKVIVSFIMTSKSGDLPIEKVQLFNQKQELYSELITLYNVYIPTVLDRRDSCDRQLVILSEFFSITDYEQMKRFIQTYENDTLAQSLISAYSKAILQHDVDNISEREYFSMKISEEEIKQAYEEGMEKGMEKGIAEGIAEGIARQTKALMEAMKKRGIPDEEIQAIASMA